MYLEELVEVAVGLILVYILLSLAVSNIQEWISRWINNRSAFLETTLREMLAETLNAPEGGRVTDRKSIPENKSGITEKVYNHPMIKSLYQGKGRPSYIPADKFVLALFDIVVTAGSDGSTIEKALQKIKSYKERVPEASLAGLEAGIDELARQAKAARDDPVRLAALQQDIENFAQEFKNASGFDVKPIFEGFLQAELPVKEEEVIQALKRGAAMLTTENLQLKQTLDDLVYQAEVYIKGAEGKLAQIRANAEKWFDDTMDRAAGWYKRSAQFWAFYLGLILALFFNLDTVEIASRLWVQPTLRHSLIRAAETYQLEDINAQDEAPNPVETITRLQSSLTGLHLPVGWAFQSLGPDSFNPAVDRCTLFPRSTSEVRASKDVYGLSINGTCKRWTNPPRGWGFLSKAIGLLITALAARLGAPFWFEILRKLVNVRSTGIKPEEKREKK